MKKNYKSILTVILFILAIKQVSFSQKFYSAAGDSIFYFNTSGNTITHIATFSLSTVYQPNGRIVNIGNGEFMGMTIQSSSMYGSFYKMDTAGNSITVLHEFTNNNRPQSSFVLADNGKLYGLGYTGTSNESAIYSYDIATDTYTNVYEIIGNAQSGIYGGMIKANNGILYGVTKRGGTNNSGRIFSFNTSTNTYTSLYEFSTATGEDPNASMIQASNGKLYGTTSYGGANNHGVLFSFDISNNTYTKLFDFVQSTGESPTSPLMQASSGLLYGTTMAGGANYQGVLYSFDISNNTYTCLHSFFASEGYGPRTEPIEGPNGIIYGTTNQGGSNFKGSIYSFDIANSTFTKLIDGTATIGNFVCPFLSFQPIGNGNTGITEKGFESTVSVYPNPANDLVIVKSIPDNSKVSVTDVTGKIVFRAAAVGEQTSISTADFENGIYFIRIESNGNIANKKLVVNK